MQANFLNHSPTSCDMHQNTLRDGARKMRISLKLALLLVAVAPASGLRCDRTPEGIEAPRSSLAGRFLIDISGNPTGYVPGDNYTITLRPNSSYSDGAFAKFLLMVDYDNSQMILDAGGQRSIGHLVLQSTITSRFHLRCENTVTQMNTIPKTSVQVYWIAPPSGNGCVAFKATVVESKEVWYSEEGGLTKILCEEIKEDPNKQLPILNVCRACSEAKYEVAFEGLWSRNTHPKDFPINEWLTKFSDIIGASHTVNYTFWKYGGVASEGMRQLAENGNTKMLESELKNKSEHIRTIIKARGLGHPNITGKTFAVFRVDSNHHLMSLVSMIQPSPDWIVGVSSLELCRSNGSTDTWVESQVWDLFPWDAGTTEGISYMSDKQPSMPRDKIRRITSSSPNNPLSPFYDEEGGEIKPMARLYLNRQRLYEKECELPMIEAIDPNGPCEVSNWSPWSPCTVTCGRGYKYRQRRYVKTDTENCFVTLTERARCNANMRHCGMVMPKLPEEYCELTDWGEWSRCSVTCGNGTKTRSRRYKTRNASKRCRAGTEHAPPLEQNLECKGEGEDCPEPLPPYTNCPPVDWSDWSPCSSDCGIGTKTRTRLYLDHSSDDFSTSIYNPHERKNIENTNDLCDKRMEEVVECANDDRPTCEEDTTVEAALACSLPKDVGMCMSNIDRWFFDNIMAKCEVFSYSGCKGNHNNFKSLELCEKVCNEYKITDQNTNHIESGSQINQSGEHEITNTVDVIHETFGRVFDCVVSEWSDWTPCNISLAEACGHGHKKRSRHIISHPRNGGKPCPTLLMRVRKCEKKCKGVANWPTWNVGTINVDCVLTTWSAWSPCSKSCGPNSFRIKTRGILTYPSGGGTPCTDRVQQEPCSLSACPF